MPNPNVNRRMIVSGGYGGGSSIPPDPIPLEYLEELPITPTSGFRSLIINDFAPLIKDQASLIDRYFISCVDYRQNAYYSYINPTLTPSEEQGAMLWNQYGFKGAANSYVNTHFNFLDDSVNYEKNKACFFYYSLTDLNSGGANDGGAQDQVVSPERGVISFGRGGANIWYASINDNTGGNIQSSGQTTSIGFYSLVRTGATSVEKYFNGVLIDTASDASTDLPDLEAWMFGLNRNDAFLFSSERQLPIYGFASSDVDQSALYNATLALVNGMAALYPSPPTPATLPINNARVKLAIPSLVDQSGNGFDSVLGASLPVGFTTPTIDGDNNIDFNGLQTIKLNTSFTLTALNLHTEFFTLYTDTPEVTQGMVNPDLLYAIGTRLFVSTHDGNKFVTAGGVYFDEAAATPPVWGRSLPKFHQGYNVVGLAFSDTVVYMYLNGMVTYFTPNNAYPAGGISGWIGAFPGGASANFYALPAYYKLLSGSHVEIFNYAATKVQTQAKGNDLMYQAGLSLAVFEVDSITQGFTLTDNADNYVDKLIGYLNANTSHKWAACNMAIGGRGINEAAVEDVTDSTVTYNWTTTAIITPVLPVLGSGNKNIYVLLGGVNDIADGRTLMQLQADFTTLINYRNTSGFNCFVLSVTGDSVFDAGMEAIRLAYNAWLATQETTLNFTFIDICNNITGANTSPIDAGLRNDGVHWNDTMHTAVFDYAKTIILSNL